MDKSKSFQLYSYYYALLYKDKNTKDECKYVTQLLEKFGVPGKNWTEFGSGSGRHGEIFESLGIVWQGVDSSESMVEEGRKKGLKINLADISEKMELPNKQDAVLALFHVVSYLTSNIAVLQAFKNAAACLVTGGLFVFDVWYSPAVLTQLPKRRIKEVESNELRVEREAKPTILWNRNIVSVQYDIKVTNIKTNETQYFQEDHLMRHFSLPELEMLAELSGFEFVHSEEWMTQSKIGKDTWGICCVLRKLA